MAAWKRVACVNPAARSFAGKAAQPHE